MSEQRMIERVAMAILREQEKEPFPNNLNLARAAIEAMRRPTQEMRQAAWQLLDDNAKAGNLRSGSIVGNGMPDAILSTMIDAAVKETA